MSKPFLVTAGLFLAACVAWKCLTASRPTIDHGIMADLGGPIRLVVCSATSARKSSLRNADLVSNIVNGLPSDTHVLLLVNDRAAFEVAEGDRKITFVDIAPDHQITIWPQDPFVVLNDRNGDTRLLISRQFSRHDDQFMAQALADTLKIEARQSELEFEGGNIVANKEQVLIGYDTIRTNQQELQIAFQDVVDRFAKEFHKPVQVIGKRAQTVGHIDMLITPLGERTFAVANSRAGADIVNGLMNESPAAVQRFERQCERTFFGKASIDQLVDAAGESIECPHVVGETKNAIAFSQLLAQELDQIASQLESLGYRVIRVPALIPDQNPSPHEELSNRPGYPFLTYNNVLIQQDQGVRTVFLPQYGLARLDATAVAVWEELGFFVVPIDGFATSAMYGGGMRCCTKVLLRN